MKIFPEGNTFTLTLSAFLLLLYSPQTTFASKLAGVHCADQHIIMIEFIDGEVTHNDNATGVHAYSAHSHEKNQDTVKRYTPLLDVDAATTITNWTIKSTTDKDYSGSGLPPLKCHRKSKVNGHAENEWAGSDYQYDYTYKHTIFLALPKPLKQGQTYTITLNAAMLSDKNTATLTFDIYQSVSEAIHVNLVGYDPKPDIKAADVYLWMGDGGARDYTAFQNNKVYIHNIATQKNTEVGKITFWKNSGSDVGWYNLTRSAVWNADFTGFKTPGTYRLAIEGIGCSQDFQIKAGVYGEPFKISTLGFFYMRIGQDSAGGISPVPRRPLWLAGKDPADCKIYLTTMHPYHAEWKTFSGGDVWDRPKDWANYRKPGNPVNPNAWGGHSDALDWDRHLGHVSIIYDMLLPFILTNGAIDEDDLGIAESGNGIPDILDEARNEVDFWLRLRDGKGYSHGLTNPDKENALFQAAPTAMAAWANAANAAMLAEGFRIAKDSKLMEMYRDSSEIAFNYANDLTDKGLDKSQSSGEAVLRGRDFKLLAAAYLYNITGKPLYEKVISEESVCKTATSVLDNFGDGDSFNQVWASAAYVTTQQKVNYPELQSNMKSSLIFQAKQKETNLSTKRPSRRGTDQNSGYFRTTHNMQRTIIGHAISTSPSDKAAFRKAMILEADYGLGRNPMNIIQMTTSTTALQDKRSVQGAYTSGRNDGSPGMHPGHTPYMNLDDWSCGMTMGCPSKLYQNGYPKDFKKTWPIGEGYFNTRYVWAHTEFTPQQTMRGKQALYGYLYGLGKVEKNADIKHTALARSKNRAIIHGKIIYVGLVGLYELSIRNINGRKIWSGHQEIKRRGLNLNILPKNRGLNIIHIKGHGINNVFKIM